MAPDIKVINHIISLERDWNKTAAVVAPQLKQNKSLWMNSRKELFKSHVYEVRNVVQISFVNCKRRNFKRNLNLFTQTSAHVSLHRTNDLPTLSLHQSFSLISWGTKLNWIFGSWRWDGEIATHDDVYHHKMSHFFHPRFCLFFPFSCNLIF